MPNVRMNAMQQVNMATAGMNPNAIRASMQGGNMNAMPNINVMASQAMQANNMGNVMQNTIGNMQQGNMPAGAINVANITMGEYCAGVILFAVPQHLQHYSNGGNRNYQQS